MAPPTHSKIEAEATESKLREPAGNGLADINGWQTTLAVGGDRSMPKLEAESSAGTAFCRSGAERHTVAAGGSGGKAAASEEAGESPHLGEARRASPRTSAMSRRRAASPAKALHP